jgi:hypothetical protein
VADKPGNERSQGIFMNSIDIFRQYRNLQVTQLINSANINKQSYYNAASGEKNISSTILGKLDSALKLNGFLHIAHLFDRLHRQKVSIPIQNFSIPDRYSDLGKILLAQHPIFQRESKYNRLLSKKSN